MISEILLGLAGCFLLCSCYFFKNNNKNKNKKKHKKVVKINKSSIYSNPPYYDESVYNNPIIINHPHIYEQNSPPEYSEN